MIATDTSAWIDYSKGNPTQAAQALEKTLRDGTLVLPLPVYFEILSGPGLTREAHDAVVQLPRLETVPGFWERAGEMRNFLLKHRHKARAMDCLIAQNCIDAGVMLIVSDLDFRHFGKFGLQLFERP
jgi:predicted nucleic acid-binding protein